VAEEKTEEQVLQINVSEVREDGKVKDYKLDATFQRSGFTANISTSVKEIENFFEGRKRITPPKMHPRIATTPRPPSNGAN